MPRAKRKVRRRRKGLGTGRRGRPGKLAGLSIEQLQAEIDRRRRAVPMLMRERQQLAEGIAWLDRQLSSLGAALLGGAPPSRRRGRPPGSGRRGRPRGRARNANSLVATLQRVLKGRTLSIAEAIEAVGKAGYKSGAKNFRLMVNQALLANKKLFRKVARGQYTAR